MDYYLRLKYAIFHWLSDNPGNDALDIARHFKIDIEDAIEIVNSLLQSNLVEPQP